MGIHDDCRDYGIPPFGYAAQKRPVLARIFGAENVTIGRPEEDPARARGVDCQRTNVTTRRPERPPSLGPRNRRGYQQ